MKKIMKNFRFVVFLAIIGFFFCCDSKQIKNKVEVENKEILDLSENTYSSIISNEEIYDFLNWMTIKNEEEYYNEPIERQVYYKIVKWDMANFIPINPIKKILNSFFRFDIYNKYIYESKSGTDTIFKQEDRNFLFLQFNAIKDTIWHDSFSKSELTKQFLYARYYSIPLFSLDRNYVIIYREYYCGSECAYGGIYVYRRIDKNNWVFVTSVNTWIS